MENEKDDAGLSLDVTDHIVVTLRGDDVETAVGPFSSKDLAQRWIVGQGGVARGCYRYPVRLDPPTP